MTRTIPVGIASQVAATHGSEPLFVVEVSWDAVGWVRYADRDWDGIPGRVLSLGAVSSTTKEDGSGTASDVTVDLDDVDGSIRGYVNASRVHKCPARVWLCYGDSTWANRILLLSGDVVTPIRWGEQDRRASITILSKFESRELGFAPEQGEFDFIADSAVGKPWPLCFGSPVRVPAVKIVEAARGRSLTHYGLVSRGNLQSLYDAVAAKVAAVVEKGKADVNLAYNNDNYGKVVDSLTAATTTVNSQLNQLIFDNPAQEANLVAYVANADLLVRARRNSKYYAALIRDLDLKLAQEVANLASLTNDITAATGAGDDDLAATLTASYATLDAQHTSDSDQRSSLLIQLLVEDSNITTYEAVQDALVRTMCVFDLSEIVVENGDKFPQGTPVHIRVNNLRLRGTFTDNVFAVDSMVPTETNVAVAVTAAGADSFTIPSGVDLSGLYCFCPGLGIIYVEAQADGTCRFSPLLYAETSVLGTVYEDGAFQDRPVYSVSDPGEISEASPIVPQVWVDNVSSKPDYANGISNAYRSDWQLSIGDEVVLDEGQEEVYVANLIPSTSVVEVVGRRNGALAPIPTDRYVVDLSESIAGQNATTLRFYRPLASYAREGWTDEVYVSLVSSVGPNTADVLQWIAENYTDLAVDATTFASVRAAVDAYPSHFAILEQKDAAAAISEIAWQARCATFIEDQTLYLHYLPIEPSSDMTVDESYVTDLSVEPPPTEGFVTKFVANWRADLSIQKQNQVVIRNNVSKYGLVKRDFNFYIYNTKDLVTKSATFWAIRMSNAWKRVKFTAYLDTVKLESFDCVTVDWTEDVFANAAQKGVIRDVSFDTSAMQISYTVELPIRVGEMTQYDFYWSGSAAGTFASEE